MKITVIDLLVERISGAPFSRWRFYLLHSPGADTFQTASFDYASDDIDENGPSVAGRFFFNEARFGVDLDGVDGIDADANEFTDVVAGSITVTRITGRTRP